MSLRRLLVVFVALAGLVALAPAAEAVDVPPVPVQPVSPGAIARTAAQSALPRIPTSVDLTVNAVQAGCVIGGLDDQEVGRSTGPCATLIASARYKPAGALEMALNLTTNGTTVRWVPTLSCYCDFPEQSSAQVRWSYEIWAGGALVSSSSGGCSMSRLDMRCNLGAGGAFDCVRTLGTATLVYGISDAYDLDGYLTPVSPREELLCN